MHVISKESLQHSLQRTQETITLWPQLEKSTAAGVNSPTEVSDAYLKPPWQNESTQLRAK
jgi:hypothetical protein